MIFAIPLANLTLINNYKILIISYDYNQLRYTLTHPSNKVKATKVYKIYEKKPV